jgi:hypothetical protein
MNYGTVVFTVEYLDSDDITVTIELLEGEGVTVEPTTMVVSDYGPYFVTITNYTADNVEVRLRITLDNGYGQTSEEAYGVVEGVLAPEGSICILPWIASVEVGDVFTATVFVREIEYPAAYFWVALPYYDGLEPLSFNLGWPGGDFWEKDGPFWEEFPELVHPYPSHFPIEWAQWIELSMWAEGENPAGAPAGTSGPLCNLEFKAVEPGTWYIGFLSEGTRYGEPDKETWHDYTDYLGCEVTVTEAEE